MAINTLRAAELLSDDSNLRSGLIPLLAPTVAHLLASGGWPWVGGRVPLCRGGGEGVVCGERESLLRCPSCVDCGRGVPYPPVSPPACLAAPSHTDADASLGVLTQHLRSSALPHRVLLDCSASDTVAQFYRRWMEQVCGVGVWEGEVVWKGCEG